MVGQLVNPFDMTKAGDLSDEQIGDLWVDMPGGASLVTLVKPTSRMPTFILGGKGSGKTHLMRYLSYPLQKRRHGSVAIASIVEDGYVGIYLRCDGLNTGRFSGKGLEASQWRDAFSYYVDLWLAQLALSTAKEVFGGWDGAETAERAFCRGVADLIDGVDVSRVRRIDDLLGIVRGLQREVDVGVNNYSMTRKLSLKVRVSPGRLVFGVPRLLIESMSELSNVVVVYLVDEAENLSVDQQRYFNTLVRERQRSATFKIGARLYGIKTYGTYSGNEEIRPGSEFEQVFLDEILRRQTGTYAKFARRLVERRLIEGGLLPESTDQGMLTGKLDRAFGIPENGRFNLGETRRAVEKYEKRERPYFRGLRQRLQEGLKAGAAPGVHNDKHIERIIHALKLGEVPLLEKFNVFMLYRAWSSGEDLLGASEHIGQEARAFFDDAARESAYETSFKLFKQDMLAQLFRECDLKQRYVGLDTFIEMSQGFPRNLLIILKHVFSWSTFNGEAPFRRGQISIDSQREGVSEASLWFFDDARVAGDDGSGVRAAVERVATLFKALRFSDKPAESSLVTFSCDFSSLSDEARDTIELAEKWSLLIRIRRGQRDRNTSRIDRKYQLNPMLAPRWDLPTARRGTIALRVDEADAILSRSRAIGFEAVLESRLGRMTAPWFRARGRQENDPVEVSMGQLRLDYDDRTD